MLLIFLIKFFSYKIKTRGLSLGLVFLNFLICETFKECFNERKIHNEYKIISQIVEHVILYLQRTLI